MTTQNYLVVENNTVTNIVVWDGNTQTWAPPADATMLVQATTPTKVWGLNPDGPGIILVNQIGGGQIGFTWDGSALTTNEPKPEPRPPAADQPVTTGTTTL
jgi:hypothetical protein